MGGVLAVGFCEGRERRLVMEKEEKGGERGEETCRLGLWIGRTFCGGRAWWMKLQE